MKRLSPSVVEADLSYESAEGFRRDFLLISDVHWDSKHCDRKLLKEHLDEAVRRNAPVFIFGDLFDAMQGTRDPRAMKGDLRHELDNPAYFDRMVEDCADWLEPYKGVIKVISKGNHELSVIKHYGTDLTERICSTLNQRGGECYSGGYEGWVLFIVQQKKPNSRPSNRKTLKLYYNHGSGGSSPVTKGTIKASRRAAYLPDADVIATGHIHESWQVEFPRLRMTKNGRLKKDVQTHIQLAAYVDDRDESGTSWPIMKEFSPKPLGGWWLTFSVRNHESIYEVTRAK